MLWNQLNILEAHPGVWEMEEQGEFYVWGTGVGISNFNDEGSRSHTRFAEWPHGKGCLSPT